MRDDLSRDMRTRLLTNRHGKLTSDQWKDMVTEPLVVLLLLLAPAIMVLGPRMGALIARGWLVMLIGVLLALVIPMLFRAQRYARAPIYFEQLYAGDNPAASLMFWRPQIFYTQSGDERRFKKRLAPSLRLRANHAYAVYYLRDADQLVLLSIAPADHPDAAKWQPSTAFHERFARRT
jgi:hypothetical protein